MSTEPTWALPELRQTPKSDLHAHLLLSAPRAAYQALSSRAIPHAPEYFGSLAGAFTYMGDYLIPVLNSVDNVRHITRAALTHFIADGVCELEASVGLTGVLRAGTSWAEYGRVLAEELSVVRDSLTVRLELGHARELPTEWKPLLGQALATGIFSGIDLYGEELHEKAAQFTYFFDAARANGLYTKLHCGEVSDVDQMEREVEILRPDQIQHGIAAAKSPQFMKHLATTGIRLNLCPTSNVKIGAVSSYQEHPIRTLVDHGVSLGLGSDDYAVFGVSVSEEYQKLLNAGLLTKDELERVRVSGLDYTPRPSASA